MAAKKKPAKKPRPAGPSLPAGRAGAAKARTTRTRSAADWAPAFLAAVSAGSSVKDAAAIAKVGRRTVYERRDSDPGFAASLALALEDCCDDLESEARRRAKDGVERPVFYKGAECGRVREYSDGLLVALLKAHRPEKYRDASRVEHTGKDGGAFEQVIVYLPAKQANDPDPTPAGPGALPL